MSATTESPAWQHVLDWVVMTHELLTAAGAQGGRRVSTWLTATSAETLELAFRCWADQGSERGRATHGTAWTELRADAGRVARPLVDCLYPQGARTPLTALEKGTWTDTLNPIRDWARREYAEKSRFLDEEWARVVLGALIHREVRVARLPASVVAAVERRVLPHS